MLPRWATAEGFYGGALELQCELVVPHFAACNASRISHWCGEFIARCRGNTQPPSEIRAAPVLVTRRTAPWRHQTKCISYEAHTTPGRALLLGPWTGIGGEGMSRHVAMNIGPVKLFLVPKRCLVLRGGTEREGVSGPPGVVWSSGGCLVLRGGGVWSSGGEGLGHHRCEVWEPSGCCSQDRAGIKNTSRFPQKWTRFGGLADWILEWREPCSLPPPGATDTPRRTRPPPEDQTPLPPPGGPARYPPCGACPCWRHVF